MNIKDPLWQQEASATLNDQIMNNQNYLNDFFKLYSETKEPSQQAYLIIQLKFIVTMIFEFILENFDEFHQMIEICILSSYDPYILRMFADLVYHISLRLISYNYPQEDIWEYLCHYLLLYQTQKTALPFSIYLCSSLLHNKNFYLDYQEPLEKITSPIIFDGLNSDDYQAILDCTKFFGKIYKDIDDYDNFSEMHEENFAMINYIAENSLEFCEYDENAFYRFWSSLYKVDTAISYPLLETSLSILPSENLCPMNRYMLLNFIIRRSDSFVELVNDKLDKIIYNYFYTQCELEDLDNSSFIYKHFKKVDVNKSCETFINIIDEFLKDDDYKKQLVGLSLLPGLFDIYEHELCFDISEIFTNAINAATNSDDHLKKWLIFLQVFLKNNKFDSTDSETILNFLIKSFLRCTDRYIQYRILDICKKLTVNQTVFENMIDIFQHIKPESYAIYFSILIYFYNVQIDTKKHETFCNNLIDIIEMYIQKVKELSALYQPNFEIQEILHQYTLIQGSACNLIFYLHFNSPQLEEAVNFAKDKFFNIILLDKYDLCYIDDYKAFGLYSVKEDFSYIVRTQGKSGIESIINYIDWIVIGAGIESLQHYICLYPEYGIKFYQKKINEFNDVYEDYINDPDKDIIKYIISNIIDPMSEWICHINNELYNENLDFIDNLNNFIDDLIQPGIECDIYNSIFEILSRIIEHESENEWYEDFIETIQNKAARLMEIIPK